VSFKPGNRHKILREFHPIKLQALASVHRTKHAVNRLARTGRPCGLLKRLQVNRQLPAVGAHQFSEGIQLGMFGLFQVGLQLVEVTKTT